MLLSLVRITSVALFLYVGLAAAIYYAQEHLMFHFLPVADNYQYQFETPYEDVLLTRGNARLHGVVFKAPEKPRGLLVYYKGNMGHVGYSEEIARPFLALGFDVLSMDYRGFGKSRGELSEAALLHDAEVWYDWAAARYGEHRVRLLGYSMGTTFASHVAAVRNVSNVILFAPMKSLIDVAARRYPYLPVEWLSEYPLRNDLKLAKARGHIVIYHGTDDDIIAFESGAALKAVLGPDDSFVSVPGGTHYDIPSRADVLEDISMRWGARTATLRQEPVLPQGGAGLSIETARPN